MGKPIFSIRSIGRDGYGETKLYIVPFIGSKGITPKEFLEGVEKLFRHLKEKPPIVFDFDGEIPAWGYGMIFMRIFTYTPWVGVRIGGDEVLVVWAGSTALQKYNVHTGDILSFKELLENATEE